MSAEGSADKTEEKRERRTGRKAARAESERGKRQKGGKPTG